MTMKELTSAEVGRAMNFTTQFLTNVLEVPGEMELLTVEFKAAEDGTTTVYPS